MPGVPSGRGCEACRKQKKKCDQGQPKCARCTRLNIPCIGCGEQRYKFKESSLTLKKKASSPSQATSPASGAGSAASLTILQCPANQADLSTLEYISLFQVDDLSYDICCYGMFLRRIPSRMGRSETLDASAVAVSKSLRAYQRNDVNAEALGSYVRAIKVLRATLQNPDRAHTAETLISIYMIMICQGWLGCQTKISPNHGEGLAAVLNAATQYGLLPSLGAEIAYTMAIAVVIESISNPKIPLEPWLTGLIDYYASTTEPLRDCDETLRLVRIARIPMMIREPLQHMNEIKATYQIVQADYSSAYQRYVSMTELFANQRRGKNTISNLRMLVGYQTAYGMFLAFGLIFGAVVLADDPSNETIADELLNYRQEIVKLANVAMEHRPLGGCHASLGLMVAWAVADEPTEKAHIWSIIEEYQKDFPAEAECWSERGLWLRSRIDSVRIHRLLSNQDYRDTMAENMDGSNLCTVM